MVNAAEFCSDHRETPAPARRVEALDAPTLAASADHGCLDRLDNVARSRTCARGQLRCALWDAIDCSMSQPPTKLRR